MKEDFENVKSVRLHYRYARDSRYTVDTALRSPSDTAGPSGRAVARYVHVLVI